MCTFAAETDKPKNSKTMTKRLFATMMLVLTALTVVTAQNDKAAVIICAGQSNAAGRADNATLPEYIQQLGATNGGAYKYCQWSYTNGGSRTESCEGVFRPFWPEREKAGKQFAFDAITYYWVEQALQRPFYVVKHAMGGTSIDPTCQSSSDFHWSADATWLAENASCNQDGKSMLKALCDNIGASLDAIGTGKYDVKCLLWHQGESDRSGTGPDGYHDNLQAVVKYIRDYLVEKTGDAKYASLPVIAGTVPTNSKQYNKKVYDALFALQNEDAHFHVVETSPGTFIGDQLHFDTNCAERLGIGMYNKMVELGLVSGQKQAVPDAVLPEAAANTLDFKTWTTNQGMTASDYQQLILSDTPLQAADGTPVYKAIGCTGDGDFSEFAETFALAENTTKSTDKVRLRGTKGLFLNSKQQTVISILNLNSGDGITFSYASGTKNARTLSFLSTNVYLESDKSQTIAQGDSVTKQTYIVKSGTQLDLTFGDGVASHSIESIKIEPGKAEVTETPTPTPEQGNERMLWGSINSHADASAKTLRAYNDQILLSWRMLPGDNAETGFDLYRSANGSDEVLLNSEAITGRTNWQDKTANRQVTNTYRLTLHGSDETIGRYTMPAAQAQAGWPYIEIALKDTKDVCALDTIWYEANDASVGDLDGDGTPEIVVKRLLTHGAADRSIVYEGTAATESPHHVRHTVLYEAYRLDGTFLWRICSGPNIMLGNSSSFAIADFDGDGRAEMAIKTGEGTVFGDGQEIGDTDGDGKTDYRENGKHYIGQGPEFFSVVDGETGRELARANYIARGKSEDWGDDYFKRASSLRVAVVNVSGDHPSVLICRGVYERSVLEAWDYNNGHLTRRWNFDTKKSGKGKDGKAYSRYAAQGFHSLSVGDVDGDGKDEIVYGSMTVDDDGQGLYTSEYGHGDALHLGKFDPQRDGLQIISCQEFGKTMVVLRDAATGATIWKQDAADDNDTGRAMIADIDPTQSGCEMWWYKSNAHSISGQDLGYQPTSCNMAIWFGEGLNRQLLNETSIHQQHDNTRIFSLYRYDVIHINGTKGNPCWYGDLVGDWREEIIMPDATRTKNIKVFSTWYPSDHKFPWLMTDHIYAMSAKNQNVGYNMPTQLGYYLGSDLKSDSEAWTTGVSNATHLNNNEQIINNKYVYDLQGRRIGSSLKRGIYIRNGKKYAF